MQIAQEGLKTHQFPGKNIFSTEFPPSPRNRLHVQETESLSLCASKFNWFVGESRISCVLVLPFLLIFWCQLLRICGGKDVCATLGDLMLIIITFIMCGQVISDLGRPFPGFSR